jgi:hypothetical protein
MMETDLARFQREKQVPLALSKDIAQAVSYWGTGAAPYALGLLEAIWQEIEAGRAVELETDSGWTHLRSAQDYWSWLQMHIRPRDVRDHLGGYLERWGVLRAVGRSRMDL